MAWSSRATAYIHKHIQLFTGVGLATAVAVSMLPQTAGLSRYKKLVAHYVEGEEMLVDSNVKLLIDKVFL